MALQGIREVDVNVAVSYKALMKIIAGKWRGRKLPRKVNPKMRPSSNKVREAIFGILESRAFESFENLRILELFAGTGAFGLEALSRGAEFVSFVDRHFSATRELKKILSDFEMQDFSEVECRGVLEAIGRLEKSGRRYPLVFMDPPYRQDWIIATCNRLQNSPILAPKALIVAEHEKNLSLRALEGHWQIVDARRYGDTAVSFLCSLKDRAYWLEKFGQE